MEVHLKIIGSLLIPLGLVHIIFPNYFKWKTELANLSLINRQMMKVHAFFIAFVVSLMGILCIVSAREIIETPLGKTISIGMAIFWGVRALFQFFVYSPKLWRGKTFETIVHITFSMVWIYITSIFIIIVMNNSFKS